MTPRTLSLVALTTAGLAGAIALGLRAIERSEHTEPGMIDGESIVMLGDSITEQGNWAMLLPDWPITNHGHSGFTSEQLVPVCARVAASHPEAVYLLAGTNDIRDGRPAEWTAKHLDEMIAGIQAAAPDTDIVVQSVLPRDDHPDLVRRLNEIIRRVAVHRGVSWLDLHSDFDDGSGRLRRPETTDGLHLAPAGYDRWAEILARRFEEAANAAD